MRVVNSQFATVNYNRACSNREHLFASVRVHFLNRSVISINENRFHKFRDEL